MSDQLGIPEGVNRKTPKLGKQFKNQYTKAEADAIIKLGNTIPEIRNLLKDQELLLREQKSTLKKNYKERIKKEKKEKFKANTKKFFEEKAKEAGQKAESTVQSALSLYTQPLKQLIGVDLGEVLTQSVREGWGFIRGKKGKNKPKVGDVIKTGDPGTNTLYLANVVAEALGKDEEDGLLGGLFDGDIGNIAQQMFPTLMKKLPIAALAGGIIWGVMDAIIAVGQAEEWGVEGWQAGLAGFLAGKAEGGWDNALQNAAKGAAIGLGLGGLAGGPMGMLAGALIGGAIGGLLGFIGAEDLAKGINDVWDSLQKDSALASLLGGVGGGLAGAAIGFAIGGPAGAVAGALLGAAIGGILGFVASNSSDAAEALREENYGSLVEAGVVGGVRTSGTAQEIEQSHREALQMAQIGSVGAVNTFRRVALDRSIFNTPEKLFANYRAMVMPNLRDFNIDADQAYGILYNELQNSDSLNLLSEEELQYLKSQLTPEEKRIYNVNDAIITKTGQIIETHPDDNIIATKNDPMMMSSRSTTSESSEEIKLLRQEIAMLKDAILQLRPQSNTIIKRELVTSKVLEAF